MAEYSIQSTARRSGVDPALIRAWERRYAAVRPIRSLGGHRIYSEADIRRLRLLKAATDRGHRIGLIAELSDEALIELTAGSPQQPEPKAHVQALEGVLDQCLAAVESLDAETLERLLIRATVALDPYTLVDDLIAPMMRRIGELWWSGEFDAGHEHLATSVVRTVLARITTSAQATPDNPQIVVCTPAGQHHELGAMLAAAAASSEGWRIVYLGANMPAQDIVSAVHRRDAAAVALSVIHPERDRALAAELRQLRRELPPSFPILVGGAAAASYGDVLEEIHAIRVDDLSQLRVELARWISSPRASLRAVSETKTGRRDTPDPMIPDELAAAGRRVPPREG